MVCAWRGSAPSAGWDAEGRKRRTAGEHISVYTFVFDNFNRGGQTNKKQTNKKNQNGSI